MFKVKIKNAPIGCTAFMLILWLYGVITYFVNIYQLAKCNFDAPWKDEVIHLIGLIPPCNMVTVWL